jgi:hypothetical protein
MTFSRVFAMGDRRDIGRYDVPMLRSFSGFGMGTIFASFQICGMILRFRARFRRLVR